MALKNCSLLLKPGGQIIHILPTNNFCGHGFYQFSPELFFSLYSHKNGYDETEVFLAETNNLNNWYKVKKPQNGERVNILNFNSTYILVRSILKKSIFDHSNIQQSDYEYVWSKNKKNPYYKNNYLKKKLAKYKYLYKVLKIFNQIAIKPFTALDRLNQKNPGLIKFRIKDFLN